ncbi:MAG: NAD-dependent epimerase/dehydratase family protein [Actinobacteria bacterium]|nr:NAD-dependent epimerase/dehydratase family protein [Actinomycetota bacterium]
MRTLVTGAAGFIGSHLCERLLADGHTVRAIDSFTDYYPPESKRRNIAEFAGSPAFELLTLDLSTDKIDQALAGVDVVFHLAGQPGVRLSWADGFRSYAERNILATQRLLEATRRHALRRLVFSSSSSVYGNLVSYPTPETDLPRPYSPYGVTKLAAEHLCSAYAENFAIPAVSLRYFTVYGPRQRPDMAFHRLIEAGLGGPAFPAYGDGSAIRSFTFVDDVVEANMAAASAELAPGEVFNISGGSSVAMSEAYEIVSSLTGSPTKVDVFPPKSGDVQRTGGAVDKAERLLGWVPKTDIRTGLAAQVAWHRDIRGV